MRYGKHARAKKHEDTRKRLAPGEGSTAKTEAQGEEPETWAGARKAVGEQRLWQDKAQPACRGKTQHGRMKVENIQENLCEAEVHANEGVVLRDLTRIGNKHVKRYRDILEDWKMAGEQEQTASVETEVMWMAQKSGEAKLEKKEVEGYCLKLDEVRMRCVALEKRMVAEETMLKAIAWKMGEEGVAHPELRFGLEVEEGWETMFTENQEAA